MWACRWYRLIILPLFCCAVFYLLRVSSPVFWDGGGPMPSFFWGESALAPTPAEYYRNPDFYEREFRQPYWIAASIVTLLACGITRITVRSTARLQRHVFLSPALVSL